jgi:hypothetical protein
MTLPFRGPGQVDLAQVVLGQFDTRIRRFDAWWRNEVSWESRSDWRGH